MMDITDFRFNGLNLHLVGGIIILTKCLKILVKREL
jgi:hypothetical protein